MKTNVNLFIALVLCAVMGGLLYFLVRPAQDDLGWNPNEMYGELGTRSYDGSSFTNATLSGASNSGVALSMPHTSFSTRTRVSPTTYSPISNSQSPIAHRQSPIANGPSPIAYTTSSAEYHSFGGGGNGNIGSAGTFRASAQSPIANSQSPIAYSQSPIAYSSIPTVQSSNNPAAVAATELSMASSAMASDYATSLFGYQSIDANDGMYSGARRSGITGRQNLGPGQVEDTWLNWLALWGQQYGKFDEGTGTWYYDQYQLRSAYDAFCASWNETMGKKPTWDEWLAWFMASEGEGQGFAWSDGTNNWTYQFVPIGNILPLLLMALLYMVILFVKRNKTAQL